MVVCIIIKTSKTIEQCVPVGGPALVLQHFSKLGALLVVARNFNLISAEENCIFLVTFVSSRTIILVLIFLHRFSL